MKVLQMLWNWIGDYRRHTLTFIYNDPLLPTREKIAQMIARHKICLGASANIIINRYKSQWTDRRINVCNDLETALKNYHLLQNINECIKDLDPAQIYTPTQIVTELIPTLHNHQFAPVIKHWNHAMTQRLPLLESSVQPALEECFVIKSSLNDITCYTHVDTTIPDTKRSSSSSSSSSSSQSSSSHASPSKQGHAYAASSQDQLSPAMATQLQKMITDAISANNQQFRSRSPSISNQPRNRDYSRDRSRDRTSDRQDKDRRPDPRRQSQREPYRAPRRDHVSSDASMPRSPRKEGDRSPSSDRKDSAPPAHSKSRA